MNEKIENLKPENWTWGWVFGILVFFLCLNLFGSKGLLHLVLLEQQNTRLLAEVAELQDKIAIARGEMDAFERDPSMQKRMLRSRMGYLKPDEFRIEFISASP